MKGILALIFVFSLFFYGLEKTYASYLTPTEGVIYGTSIGVGIGGIIWGVYYFLKEKPIKKRVEIKSERTNIEEEESVEGVKEISREDAISESVEEVFPEEDRKELKEEAIPERPRADKRIPETLFT